MEPGTYTLVLELPESRTVTFGAAGPRSLEPGCYTYTGSAFGPGGLSRVDRHMRVLDGTNDTRHWHIDYLLGESDVALVDVWTESRHDAECEIASELPGVPVDGIGATDCSCSSHLLYHPERSELEWALDDIYDYES